MKKRYLLIVAVIATLLGLVGLGLTHQQVVKMAQSIIAKDKYGDDTKADMTALTNYVHSHTRASVKFVLDGSYQRAVQQAQKAASPQANSGVYGAAQVACSSKNPVATANCIENYVQTHATPGSGPQPVVLPAQSQFTYSLNAPPWAPDLAGLSFLIAFLCLVTAVWLWVVTLATKPSYL